MRKTGLHLDLPFNRNLHTRHTHSHFRSSLKAMRKNFICLWGRISLPAEHQHSDFPLLDIWIWLGTKPLLPSVPINIAHTKQAENWPATLSQDIGYVSTVMFKKPLLVGSLMYFPVMTHEKQSNAARDKDSEKLLSDWAQTNTTHFNAAKCSSTEMHQERKIRVPDGRRVGNTH